MEKGRTGKRRGALIARIVFLTLFILECVFLCVQALLPAKFSSSQSGAFGDVIDDVMTSLGGSAPRDIPPVSITALCGEEEEDVRLFLGERKALGVRFDPEDTSVGYRDVAWHTEDENIAYIRGGKIYAAGLGETVVSAELKEGGLTDSFTLTVEEVIPDELTLSVEGGETLEVGESALLKAEFSSEGNFAVEFLSSDPSVATVDEQGVVHALTAGEATMSAVYTSETLVEGEFVTLRDEKNITVKQLSEEEILPEKISLSLPVRAAKNLLHVGDEGEILATLSPTDCTKRAVRFLSSSPEVLAVDAESGEYSALKRGSAIISAYAFGGVTASMEVEVTNASLGAELRAKGLTLSDGVYALTVTAGKEFPLKVLAEPEEFFVKFISDRPDAVVVTDAGTLLPSRAAEEVHITVTVSDDPDFSEEGGALTESITLLLKVQRLRYSDSVSGFGRLIRKLFGHFGAFLLLGILGAGVAIAFDRGSWKRRLLFIIIFLLVGFAFAGLTELLQLPLFTAGRGASMHDVGIDFCGYAPAFLIVYGVYLLVKFLLSRKKKRP